MAKRTKVTCDDCFFRRADLCALVGEPCPTFRPAKRTLTPPEQARLVPRTLQAQHAAA
ncbi:MAG: hypothetical protein ACRDM8_04915 [Gaiellaceae bacterium]|jgi:hypothetical protein